MKNLTSCGLALFFGLATALPTEARASGTVVVTPSGSGVAISPLLRGLNMANWFDVTQTGVAPALKSAGTQVLRWPGGTESDVFHWQSNSACMGAYVDTHSSFDSFIQTVAAPINALVAVTLNYGSNAACTGGGDPTEAAAWVAHAAAIGAPVAFWTVGNEVYGAWEPDLHAIPNDPTTYANAVTTGYYPQIKAANPNAMVGVVVYPGLTPAWDTIVLSKAKYDFVELHYYAQIPGSESDTYLLQSAPAAMTATVNQLKAELAAAGHPNTPIFMGELGSVGYLPGKQTESITQALYAGEVMSELMNSGVAGAAWFLAFGGCVGANSGGNFGSSLYGFQNFAGYAVFADGLPNFSCTAAPTVPLGTPLPTARVLSMISKVAVQGAHMLSVKLSGTPKTLRAYAMTQGAGLVAVLFNLDGVNAAQTTVSVAGVASGSAASTSVYSAAIYSTSQSGIWSPPATQSLGAWSGGVPVTLPPYSITLLSLTK